jgi:putative transposase
MKRKRFSEEQIIGVLKESESGLKNQDICRKHGITEQTFYRWWSKYGVNESQSSVPQFQYCAVYT